MQNPCKSLKSAIPSQYNENDIILKLRELAGGSSFTGEDFNFILEAQEHPNPIVKNYALRNNPLWFKVALAFNLSPLHLHLHVNLYKDEDEEDEDEDDEDEEDEDDEDEERLRYPLWLTVPQPLSSKVSELMRTVSRKELTESFYPVMVDSKNGIDYCWFVKAIPDPKYPDGEIYLDEFYLQCKIFYGDLELSKVDKEYSFNQALWAIFSQFLLFDVLEGINQ
jgi:hypothetical protein